MVFIVFPSHDAKGWSIALRSQAGSSMGSRHDQSLLSAHMCKSEGQFYFHASQHTDLRYQYVA